MSSHGLEIRPMHIGRELRKAKREDSHPIPEFDVPDHFERNEPMCCPDRTELGFRTSDFEYFIEVYSVPPLATIEGPYWVELHGSVGGEESFETQTIREVTGVEPGAVEEVVAELATEVSGE